MKWWRKHEPKPVLFEVHRSKDPKEISGTGHVIDGVIFPNGKTVIQWRHKKKQSVAIFDTFTQFQSVHMKHHDGSQLNWVSGFDEVGFAEKYLTEVSKQLANMRNKAPVEQKQAYAKAVSMVGHKAGELYKLRSEGIKVEGKNEHGSETLEVQVPGEAPAN